LDPDPVLIILIIAESATGSATSGSEEVDLKMYLFMKKMEHFKT
jgi:hypothetical protein